jgi:hypothetical protein
MRHDCRADRPVFPATYAGEDRWADEGKPTPTFCLCSRLAARGCSMRPGWLAKAPARAAVQRPSVVTPARSKAATDRLLTIGPDVPGTRGARASPADSLRHIGGNAPSLNDDREPRCERRPRQRRPKPPLGKGCGAFLVEPGAPRSRRSVAVDAAPIALLAIARQPVGVVVEFDGRNESGRGHRGRVLLRLMRLM